LADRSDPKEKSIPEQSNRAGIAAVLSLVVPGVGQIYNGDFLRGIFWLIITPGFWIWTAGMFGWPFHLIAAYTAYRRGTQHESGGPAR
jgi:TM2 domain-containing membrane protein YozV